MEVNPIDLGPALNNVRAIADFLSAGAASDNMTLGQFIDDLRQQPDDNKVCFDFCHFEPTVIDSYRGYYDHLALGYVKGRWNDESMTVGKLLALCESAVGSIFCGYKGGDYRMDRDTPLWVANSGETGDTAVLRVQDAGYFTLIVTGWVGDKE